MMNSTEPDSATTEFDYSDIESYVPCNNSDVKSFSAWFLPVLYSLVFLVGLLGNGLVVCVLLLHKKLRSMTDVYLLNLAISDLLFVTSLPFWSHYAAHDSWIFGGFLCKVVTGVYLTGFYASIFFITIMSIDRFMAIVFAVNAIKLRSKSHSVGISIFLWVLSLCASTPSMVFRNLKYQSPQAKCEDEFLEHQNVWNLLISFQFNILGLLIPLTIMGYCYTRILLTLMKCRNYKKVKAVKLIFVVVLVFFVFWTPYNIVIFLRSLTKFGFFLDCTWSKNLNYAMQWLETLGFTHCCLNPLIYALAGQEFKKSVFRMLNRCLTQCNWCNNCKVLTFEVSESGSSTYSKSSGEMNVTRLL
ncbi:C-C chemokine receptor type 4-like [Polypterus senegalus]